MTTNQTRQLLLEQIDYIRRDRTLTRDGKRNRYRAIRRAVDAIELLDELVTQVRPTTLVSGRAYAAQRVVEEWTGEHLAEEVCSDDGERLYLMGKEVGLAI